MATESGKLSRRTVLHLVGKIIGGFGAVSLLAACSANNSGSIATTSTTSSMQTSSTKTQPAATQAKSTPASVIGTIRVALAGQDLATAKSWEQIATAFHKEHPGITVKIENVVGGNPFQKFETEMAGAAGHDVYQFQTKQIPAFAGKGAFTILDPYIAQSKVIAASDFFSALWDKCIVLGKVVSIPWNATPVALFYSIDLFKAAGINPPPTDWADKSWTRAAFVDTATKLTKETGSGRQFGFWQSTWWVYGFPWLWSDGVHMFNKDITKAQLTSTEVINNWQFLQDLMWKYRAWPTAQESTQGTAAMFLTGKIAMYLNGTYAIPPLKAAKASITWNVAAIPSGAAGRWTRDPSASVVIWKGSKQQATSWAFVEFVGGPQGQLITGRSGHGVPARTAVARSQAFLQQNDGVNWKVFVDALDHEGLQPVTDVWPEVDNTMIQGLGNMWNNRQTAREALTALQSQIQAILEKAKIYRARPTYRQSGWISSSTGY